MATSTILKFLTLKCDISRTIWRIEVSDGSLFCIFHALSFELNLFFDRTCPLGSVYTVPDPFGTGTKLVRISLVFTRDLMDPVRIGSAIWYQMGPLMKVIPY